MKKKITFVVSIIGVITQTFAQNDTAAAYFSGLIKAENLKKYLTVLASDEFEGRETGTAGHTKTINYLSDFYTETGLDKALEKDNYFQSYNISLLGPDGMNVSIGKTKYEFMKDYYYFPGFEDVKIKTKNIIFCGYGIEDTSKKYNDYRELEIKQKIVVVLDGEPVDDKGNFLFTGTKETSLWSSNRRLKLEQAKKRGAEALFVIVDNIEEKIKKYRHNIEKPQATLEKTKQESKTDKRIPVVYISKKMAAELFEEKELEQWKIKREKTPTALGKELTLTLNRKQVLQTAENVIALVKGSEKPEEVIVLSAHLDHLGKHGEKIYYGADDDGSGTSAIMELARAFKQAEKNGYRPKRSVMFINFSGEEKGLLGSQYYSDNPVFPLNNTVANLNIDMIGRLDKDHANNPNYTYIIGSDKLSSELHSINEEANKKQVKIDLDYTYNQPNDPNRFYYRSDHYNFAKHNVPVIFYFTGVHEDYHQPTDTVDKIDFNKMEKITKLVFLTAWELANRKEKIRVDKTSDMPASR